jgi:hypothetical protein
MQTKLTSLTLSIWPYKCQFSVATTALFNLNAQCRTVFFYLDDTVVYTMGQHCLVCPLKVKEISSDCICTDGSVITTTILFRSCMVLQYSHMERDYQVGVQVSHFKEDKKKQQLWIKKLL